MAASAQPAATDYPSDSRAFTTVAVLFVATVFAYLDRQIVNLLIDPIRQSLAISDLQVGVIQGLAFVLFYSLLGIPLGRLVDRFHRRNLIVAGVLLWSLATISCGFATDFWTMFAARATVGVGEAILTPASVSLIADAFPPARRGRAISVLGMAIGIGAGGSYLLGAVVLRILPGLDVTHVPLIGEMRGWQVTFLAAGAPGLLVCLLLLLVREPPRRELAGGGGQAATTNGIIRSYLLRHWRAIASVYGAGAMLAVMSYAAHSWCAPLMMRRYNLPAAETGFLLGLLVIVAGVLGGMLCGWSNDRLARWRVGGRIWSYPIFLGIALPLAILWPLMPNAYLALAVFLACNIMYQAALLATPTMLQELVPNEVRGTLVAAYVTIMGVLGVGFGPISVALVTERVFKDNAMLWASIICVSVAALALSIVFAIFGIRAYAAARQEMIDRPAPR